MTSTRRLEAFAERLWADEMVAALVSQPADLFYLSGTSQPCNLLVMPGQGPILFARRFADLARAESSVQNIVEAAGFDAVLKRLTESGIVAGRFGMELDVIPAALHCKAMSALPGFEICDCAPALLAQRAIKDREEVDRIRQAAAVFRAVHETLAEHLAPGRSELEIAAEVERTLRRSGHEGMVANRRWDARLQPEGTIASGPNISTISGGPITISGVGLDRAYPFGASRRILRSDDLFNIDLGLNVGGYHADIARTYVLGRPSERILDLAVAVREIEDAVLASIRPGIRACEVYEAGASAAAERGLSEVFQGHGGTHGSYVGHGLGLELDEPPVLGPLSDHRLAAGMVLAVEVKLVSPIFGGVNLEDDVVVTTTGCTLIDSVERSVFVVGDGIEPLTP